jgi:hypothetical protein
MDDLTASRIEPLGQSHESQPQGSGKRPTVKREAPEKPAPTPPSVESEDKDEIHQIDELA